MSPPVDLISAALELAAVEGRAEPGLLLAAAAELERPRPAAGAGVCRVWGCVAPPGVDICDRCWRDGGGDHPWPPETTR